MGATSDNREVKLPVYAGLQIHKQKPGDRVIALAGNPNVGKSTVFNALTGMKQHTGNWPGKTVVNAQGYCTWHNEGMVLVDIPGSYSLMARSSEEEVARDFICFGKPDAVVVVCDATSLERNLNLVLQIIEASKRTVVCVNLMDEARKKHIELDLALLSKRLGVPVVGTTARSRKGLDGLLDQVQGILREGHPQERRLLVSYPDYIEEAIGQLVPAIEQGAKGELDARWLAARLLDGDDGFWVSLQESLGVSPKSDSGVATALRQVLSGFLLRGISLTQVQDDMVASFVHTAAEVCDGVVTVTRQGGDARDRRLDKLFTSKATGFPIMLLLLLLIFWFTISGASVPSELLAKGLFWLEDRLAWGALAIGLPTILVDILIHGIYNVMAWVVSVMLPPMAIFFPLFTLLEDFGYLPRMAFNLDKCFQSCDACGKQALTMCMGFGCNAAGVTGCRIIDSPRERLIAILTNSFVPCNGRFPILISIISMFLIGSATGMLGSLLGALILVGLIVVGVGMTLLVSKILSRTILKGVPSSFTLELPPYRKPQIGKVIVRSIVDRTLKVLGRAVVAAAPAGLIIWILAHTSIGGITLLAKLTGFLDPFGYLLGMDGVILTGFLLGFPANEIVIPIIIMTYLAQESLMELEGAALLQLFVQNGWTWVTAVSTLIFALFHWPCATTCLTVQKETQRFKWTALSFLLPTVSGIVCCFLFNTVVRIFM